MNVTHLNKLNVDFINIYLLITVVISFVIDFIHFCFFYKIILFVGLLDV